MTADRRGEDAVGASSLLASPQGDVSAVGSIGLVAEKDRTMNGKKSGDHCRKCGHKIRLTKHGYLHVSGMAALNAHQAEPS
jgi:hypothetical protein